jgi:hypothetical protein
MKRSASLRCLVEAPMAESAGDGGDGGECDDHAVKFEEGVGGISFCRR